MDGNTRPRTTRVNGTIRSAPIGECIYCGATCDLTDEHVIPLGLDGRLVLAEASCKACAAITSSFERTVLRGFMYEVRVVSGMATRRKKLRPKVLPLHVERAGTEDTLHLPVTEYPAFVELPLLEPAGVLAGRVPSRGVRIFGADTLLFGGNPAMLAVKHNISALKKVLDWDITAFARLLSKIAYGFAVAEFGPLDRGRVPVLPLIMGASDDASVWLGSADFKLAIEAERPMHAIALYSRPDPRRADHDLVVARVKLFASSGASGYEVVVFEKERSAGSAG